MKFLVLRSIVCSGMSSNHAFKELESSIIIIHITRLLDDHNRVLLYVGLSRAKYRLSVLISDSARGEYQEAIRRGIQKGTK